MSLRVVGAGLPRTGTESLKVGLGHLLGGRCYHMTVIPGHPFDLGAGWNQALAGGAPDWARLLDGYVAAVDWPASMFWRELSEANPDALVLLSVRDSAQTWWESAAATILPVARRAPAPNPRPAARNEGRGLVALLERLTGSSRWDDPSKLTAAYERHNAEVRQAVPSHRLLEWRAPEGWAPICRALGLPVPKHPFPWTNRRADWS